ncbi:hypothetical protein PSHT_12857 [Puccinia striiformis]|uniref:Uncharacterized protein n=1 Tax=Puccinia striiformis TaxID=27350 RepID=A0A2S4UU08_9BASI|nr:hypothetical protein PSHT_12857 [Puccinia striiformis]
MNQKWSQRPVYQMENGYETRIRYLEEVVQLLISRTNSAPTSIMSTAPQAISFRYSADRGLVPLLSKQRRGRWLWPNLFVTRFISNPGRIHQLSSVPINCFLGKLERIHHPISSKPKRDTCRSPPSSCAAGASLSSIISPIGPSSKLRERNSPSSVSKTIATAQDPMSPLLDPLLWTLPWNTSALTTILLKIIPRGHPHRSSNQHGLTPLNRFLMILVWTHPIKQQLLSRQFGQRPNCWFSGFRSAVLTGITANKVINHHQRFN